MKVCLFFAININDMTKSKVDFSKKKLGFILLITNFPLLNMFI